MPYLKEEDKNNFTGSHGLTDYMSDLSAQEFAGHVNYLNFLAIRKWIKKNGKKYWILALFIGTLICCVLEVYRRIVAPYEDDAIKKNGDV